jgi:hypothetical protein
MSQTTITKADLARELGITRAGITPYVQRGLPVRRDGRLNRAEALAWVQNNIIPSLGGVPTKRALAADGSQGVRNFTAGQVRLVTFRRKNDHFG